MKTKCKYIGISFAHFMVYLFLQIVASVIIMTLGGMIDVLSNPDFVEQVSNGTIDYDKTLELTNQILASSNMYDYVLISLLCSSILNVFYFLIVWHIQKEKPIKKETSIISFRFLGYGVLLNLIISVVLGLIDSILPLNSNAALTEMTNGLMSGNFIIVLLSVGILGPIVEEMVFRYGMFKVLSNVGTKFAIIISSLAFGIMHMNLIQSTYAMLLGLLFAYIYSKKDNLLYPILLHIGINSSSVIASICFENELIGLVVCVGISLIIIALTFLIEKVCNKNDKEINYVQLEHKETQNNIIMEDKS